MGDIGQKGEKGDEVCDAPTLSLSHTLVNFFLSDIKQTLPYRASLVKRVSLELTDRRYYLCVTGNMLIN